MKKWVKNLFTREKPASGSPTCNSQSSDGQNNAVGPSNKSRSSTSTVTSIQKSQQPVEATTVPKSSNANEGAIVGLDAQKRLRTVGSASAVVTNSTVAVEIKNINDGALKAAREPAKSVSNSPGCGIPLAMLSCEAPTKLRRGNPQRDARIQQRNQLGRREFKKKMVADQADENDIFFAIMTSSPIPVVDLDPHSPQFEQSHTNPDEVLLQHRDEFGQLRLGHPSGGTLYIFYATLDRLDVVKLIHRQEMSSPSLVETINIRTPALDGRTCLYAFAANFNLDGVRFCIQTSMPSAHEGWLTVAMAILSATARREPSLGDGLEFFNAVLCSLSESGGSHINDFLPWHTLCPWLPQHVATGQTLLHFACQHCGLPHIRLLLLFGANPTLATLDGIYPTALHICQSFQPAIAAEASQLMATASRQNGWDWPTA